MLLPSVQPKGNHSDYRYESNTELKLKFLSLNTRSWLQKGIDLHCYVKIYNFAAERSIFTT